MKWDAKLCGRFEEMFTRGAVAAGIGIGRVSCDGASTATLDLSPEDAFGIRPKAQKPVERLKVLRQILIRFQVGTEECMKTVRVGGAGLINDAARSEEVMSEPGGHQFEMCFGEMSANGDEQRDGEDKVP